jgi:Kef-type K+ transport system membrane component KefB
MGTALAITAFPMLARILHEKKLINSKIGVLSLLSASFQDVVSWIMLALVTGMALNKRAYNGLITFFGALIFIAVVFFVVKPLLNKMTMEVESQGEIDQPRFSVILVLLLLSALITDYLGLYSVFGGFILGLAMPRTVVFQKQVSLKIKDFMVVMLLPIFFAFSGLNTNLIVLQNISVLIPCLVILLFSILGKYVICTLTMKYSGFSWRESSAIGGLINARGLMELLVANIGLSYSVISSDLYSILVLMAIITTLGASPIYNYSLGRYLLKNKAATLI